MIRLTTKYIRRFFAGLYNFFKENLFQVLQTHGSWQLIILVYDILDAVIVNLTEPIEFLTAGGLVRLVGLGGLSFRSCLERRRPFFLGSPTMLVVVDSSLLQSRTK